MEAGAHADARDAYEALFMAGGGFKTVSFLGALEDLWPALQPSLRRVCGVSAGAIFALLLAAGFAPLELQALMRGTAWTDVLKDSLSLERLLQRGAPCSTAPLRRLLERWLASKGVPAAATFEWLAARRPLRFACIAARLDSGCLEQFDAEATPRCGLVRAVLASAAVPFVFDSVALGARRYVDAGIVNNCPFATMRRRWPRGRVLVLAPHRSREVPANGLAALLWHRASFLTRAEIFACAGDATVLQMPPPPADVHVFSPGASLERLLRQGRAARRCAGHRAALAGLLVLAVRRLAWRRRPAGK